VIGEELRKRHHQPHALRALDLLARELMAPARQIRRRIEKDTRAHTRSHGGLG
jgi:hypothetical protein